MNTTSLQLYGYNGFEVRTQLIDGEAWFVLNDLCRVLEIGNPRMVRDRLNEDDVSLTDVMDSLGRKQSTTIVNESGMYEVIIRSDKPEAKAFRRWLTSEVIPEIRRTGSYSKPLTLAERTAQLMGELDAVVHEQRAELEITRPKAAAWDDLVSSSGSLSFRDAAKVISEEGGVTIGGGRLIQVLSDWNWIFRPPSTPEEAAKGKVRSIRAYQTQIDAGTLTEKAKTYTDQETGEKKLSNNPQTRVTGKGLDRIRTRLIEQDAA